MCDKLSDNCLSFLAADTNVTVNINPTGHRHQWNKNMVTIAPVRTIYGCIVAWHLNSYTKWWMLKKDNLTRCGITNLIRTTGGLVWAEENGVQTSMSTI